LLIFIVNAYYQQLSQLVCSKSLEVFLTLVDSEGVFRLEIGHFIKALLYSQQFGEQFVFRLYCRELKSKRETFLLVLLVLLLA